MAPEGFTVGVIMEELPEQIVGLLKDKMEIVGVVITEIVVTAVFALAHPLIFVPVIL
jgi:hypothetical protein